jgi:hypothetical protein
MKDNVGATREYGDLRSVGWHGQRPCHNEEYRKHTTRFIHREEFLRGEEDVIVFSNSAFREAVGRTIAFIDWVVRQLMSKRDGRDPDKGPLRSLRVTKAE